MANQEKISLTRRQLLMVRNPMWACFGQYNREGCGLKCPKRTHIFCRKVTPFLEEAK